MYTEENTCTLKN
ncbi:hypothetical protein MP638_006150, partial [Amoeboaphelidium occidentale]